MTKRIERLELPPASPGTRRHLTLHRYGTPGARPKAYLQAALHANELPAMLVADHLRRRLDAAAAAGAITGEIVLVPLANPIGLAQWIGETHLGRYELSGGENFNRGFDDAADPVAAAVKDRLGPDGTANVALIRAALKEAIAARRPRGELEALRRHLLLESCDADYVLDLHSADTALMHIFLGAARWPDGADLHALTGSRATMLAAASGGEPFDEVFGNLWARLRERLGTDRPIPDATLSATLEYRGHGDVDDALAEGDADALFRFLQRRGLVAGDPGPLPAPQGEATPLAAVDSLRAAVAGIVVYRAKLGDRVAAGETVAEILDPLAEDEERRRVPVVARGSGLLCQRRRSHLVRPGQIVARIAGSDVLVAPGERLLEP